MSEIGELILRFVVVGAFAFGGGAAALPLIERIAVAETHWLTAQEFAVGVGFAYATPGPILTMAPFIGYRVAGVAGAIASTIAVFLVPVLVAAAAAGLISRVRNTPWFRGFGAFAGAAAVGLLGLTLYALSKPVVHAHPALLLLSVPAFVLAWRGVSPLGIIAASVGIGAVCGMVWPI
jgi:chromate transporter